LKPVMSNLGADAYYNSIFDSNGDLRSSPKSMVFHFQGQKGKKKIIPISSPSVGIIKLREGLPKALRYFNDDFKGQGIYRVSEFLHEGRHGDGSRKHNNLRFKHVQCPPGHPYAGINYPLCDNFHNGANMVSATGIEEMLKGCDSSCELHSKILLDMIKLEKMSRVIGLIPDAYQDAQMKELKLSLRKYKQIYKDSSSRSSTKTKSLKAKEEIERIESVIRRKDEGQRIELKRRTRRNKMSDATPEHAFVPGAKR
jgi:hypothetical protein